MKYLNFTEYGELGGENNLAAFNRFIDRAEKIVDRSTFGRLKSELVIKRYVKTCLRDMVDLMIKADRLDPPLSSQHMNTIIKHHCC